MKTTDFKLWDVFQDGMTSKLSVVVLIDNTHVHVISDKPSIYALKIHEQEVCYEVVDIKPEVVFDGFKAKMKGQYEQKVFNKALDDYNQRFKLLMI